MFILRKEGLNVIYSKFNLSRSSNNIFMTFKKMQKKNCKKNADSLATIEKNGIGSESVNPHSLIHYNTILNKSMLGIQHQRLIQLLTFLVISS